MATLLEQIWIIEDWNGNRQFPNDKFETFDLGWEFLQREFPEGDDDLQEFYVVQQRN